MRRNRLEYNPDSEQLWDLSKITSFAQVVSWCRTKLNLDNPYPSWNGHRKAEIEMNNESNPEEKDEGIFGWRKNFGESPPATKNTATPVSQEERERIIGRALQRLYELEPETNVKKLRNRLERQLLTNSDNF